jgi:hypothetical protein
MTFNTYHWHGVPLGDPGLEHARAELAAPASREALISAFLTLLRSARTSAVGTALDHYAYAEAFSRHGFGNPFEPHADELLEKARDLLRQPPLPADQSGVDEDGANHASALCAMLNLAEEEDADLVAAALAGATGPNVCGAGMTTAGRVLRRSTVAAPALVAVLREIAEDVGRPSRERAEALDALGRSTSEQAMDVLLIAVDSDDLVIQVNAAWNLAHADLDRYRPLLERVVATWPADAPYPGSDVLDLLHGD